MSSLIEELNEVCRDIHTRIPDLNSGGCGFFAYHIGKALEKTKRHKVKNLKILVEDDDNTTCVSTTIIERQPANVREWIRAGVEFGHLFIEFTYNRHVYRVDSRGCFARAKYRTLRRTFKVLPGFMELSHLRPLILKHRDNIWNPTYEHENNKIIKAHAKKLM